MWFDSLFAFFCVEVILLDLGVLFFKSTSRPRNIAALN